MTVFAVIVTCARPFASVLSGFGDVNVALAPATGAAKLIAAPGTMLPPASRTSTTSAAPKGCATIADCGLPEIAVMLAAAPVSTITAALLDAYVDADVKPSMRYATV